MLARGAVVDAQHLVLEHEHGGVAEPPRLGAIAGQAQQRQCERARVAGRRQELIDERQRPRVVAEVLPDDGGE